uniref:Uncharacterized protein n=1 Tax=Triticum urartu TaxID=4572 RepID=A0A8R7QKD7_TRIUA
MATMTVATHEMRRRWAPRGRASSRRWSTRRGSTSSPARWLTGRDDTAGLLKW